MQELNVKDLVLYDKNPRKISDENFEKLKRDMGKDKDFLKKRPLLVNKVGGKKAELIK